MVADALMVAVVDQADEANHRLQVQQVAGRRLILGGAFADVMNADVDIAVSEGLQGGYLFALSPFGWPLIIGGTLKVVYDLLLLIQFRRVRPEGETT